MQLTLDMMVRGIDRYETPVEFFQYVKRELEETRETQPYREVTLENVVQKTSMAIDFFIKDRLINKAVIDTTKSRLEVETLLNQIENYSLTR